MATPSHPAAQASGQDALLLLRQAIASDLLPVPTASGDDAAQAPLAQATHLCFIHTEPTTAVSFDSPTRFVFQSAPVDLRSIFFAWVNREVAIPEYNAAATRLNDNIAAGPSSAAVRILPFVERVDLLTWLEGATQESEYITPLATDGDGASAAAASGGTRQAGSFTTGPSASALKGSSSSAAMLGRSGRATIDPRLAAIYNGERRMGDRNTILRGVKPTDFSYVRKLAVSFVQEKSQNGVTSTASTSAQGVTLTLIPKTSSRRPDPVILLSPSASSLVRMSNAKLFLESGRFTPPDSAAASTNMLQVSRMMREIDPASPMRFILVEGPEQFKSEHWNRVVAVFTTGQLWQFKNYEWSSPADLFCRVPGIYVGWRGDKPPDHVRNWGHRVLTAAVDRWREPVPGIDVTRFRDTEVVEQIWKRIESNMISRGWKRDSAPTSL